MRLIKDALKVWVGIHRLAARHSIRAHPEAELLDYVTCHSTRFVGGEDSGSSE